MKFLHRKERERKGTRSYISNADLEREREREGGRERKVRLPQGPWNRGGLCGICCKKIARKMAKIKNNITTGISVFYETS